jgi:hypothetical protein
MADLRILEAQQHDSERKLQHAKVTKQGRLEYQTALEEKLDKCKYHNGQLAAELYRSQELLSDGQRQLNDVRKASIKAGHDLRKYDVKVNNALDIKASIIAHQRTQELWIRKLQDKVTMIDEVLLKSQQEFVRAKRELEKAEQLERTLRSDIKDENLNQQRIGDQTTKLTNEITAYTHMMETLSVMQENLKRNVEAMEKEEADLDCRRAQKVVVLEDLQLEYEKVHKDFTAEHDHLKTLMKNKNDDLHHLWHQIVQLQKTEGHCQSTLPSESDTLPVLDLSLIRKSLQVEQDAVAVEMKANEEIDELILAMQQQLEELQILKEGSTSVILELRTANANAAEVEDNRRITHAALVENYDKLRKSVDEKELPVRVLQLDHKIEMHDLNMALEDITKETEDVNKSYLLHKEKSLNLDDDIVALRADRTQLKESNEQKLLSMQLELKNARNKIALQSNTSKNDDSVEEKKRRKQLIAEQKKIDAMLAGMLSVCFQSCELLLCSLMVVICPFLRN